ncbi:hypothetical protein BJX65DRAFT_309901 [Aspergillus insuetus]
MSSNDGMSREAFLAVGICFVVSTALAVTARLWINYRYIRKRFKVDDAVAVTAIFFHAAIFALYDIILEVTPKPSTTFHLLAQLGVSSALLGAVAMWITKVPIVLFLLQVFGVKTWLKIVSITILCVSGACFLIGSSIVAGRCTPHTRDLSQQFILNCADTSTTVGVFLGTVAVVMDCIILIMPMPVIAKLKLPMRAKVNLVLLFLTGVFAITASAVSLYYKWLSFSGAESDSTAAMLCTTIECSIALLIGCAPIIYSFWTKFRPTVFTWSTFSWRSSSSAPRRILSIDNSTPFSEENSLVNLQSNVGVNSVRDVKVSAEETRVERGV